MADTGWVESQTQASVDYASSTAWSNPTNAESDDNSWATCDIPKQNTSDHLRWTNFPFSSGATEVPADATINGIEMKIQSKGEDDNLIYDSRIYLVLDGVEKGDNYADVSTDWPALSHQPEYGGAADLWNSGLTTANIRDSGFGIQLVAINNHEAANRTATIDYLWLKITYTEAAGATFIPRITGVI